MARQGRCAAAPLRTPGWQGVGTQGAYLAVPVTSKERFEGQGLLRNQDEALQLVYGGAAMQGWRRTMEDAHIAQTGLDQDTGAIFGVFDGHGGAEVALFCQKYMAQELAHIVSASPAAPAPAPAAGASSSPAAAEEAVAAVESALIDVFHRMDEMLRDHSFADEIEQLRGARDAAAEDEGGKGDEGDGLAPMDALEMIKRVFQLKRFMGENGAQGEDGEEGAGEGVGAGGDGGPAAMEADGEGPSGQAQEQEQEQGAAPGGSGSSGAAPAVAAAAAAAALRRQQQPQRQDDAGGGGGGGAAEARARFIEPADTRIQAGCTAVVAVIRAGHLFVANAGDSRGVLCRAGTAVRPAAAAAAAAGVPAPAGGARTI
ncbi:Protein phosphatase 1G [Monoraphidium neglectum]|uniref:protein-serine/threonine phosphatase n=1 Tax=Monoraphidium neglectum TaxID=145388 RepID=A0A0D2J8P4_9CHLO|nr:Protein phosphatase 1G [Monoraphidium neglectum]KIY96122.1 Protein phosphatase 1G [Monoraphidium neglectum]|eukprot:XP_013895142.1 Protein phosphatase 1G [Monoraphidium neglectum]